MLKKHRIVRFVNLKVTFLKTKSEANISVFWSCTVLSVVNEHIIGIWTVSKKIVHVFLFAKLLFWCRSWHSVVAVTNQNYFILLSYFILFSFTKI